MDEEGIKVQELFSILKKRWKLICITTLTATIFAAIISIFFIPPKYETSAKVFIGKEGSTINGIDQNYNGNDVEMYQKLLKTYAEVIQTNDLVEKAIDMKNFSLKSNDLLKNLKVTPTVDTQIIEIKYLNENKILAKNVLDSIIDEFIIESKQLIPNGNVKIIESVKMPESPVSPNKRINIAIAFFLGLIVSAGLSFFLEAIDSTFKKREQLEEILELPVLGVIPYYTNK